jgi:hypothetical protein
MSILAVGSGGCRIWRAEGDEMTSRVALRRGLYGRRWWVEKVKARQQGQPRQHSALLVPRGQRGHTLSCGALGRIPNRPVITPSVL